MRSLITTLDQFRAHVRLNASTEDQDYFLSLQADILLAEDDHLRPLLGDSFYDGLLDTVAAEGDVVQERLRYLLTSALANLAMLSFADLAQLQISGSGVQIISNEREKTAFQWQIDALKASCATKGFNQLEKALAYLEAHRTDFPTWNGVPAADSARALFLNTAAQFSEHYNISNSRLTFLNLLSINRKMERFALVPVLGQAYYDELKAQHASGTLSPENAAVVADYLRPALAHITMGSAIGEMSFALNGANFELNVFRPDASNAKESDPGLQQLLETKGHDALRDGERFLRQLRKLLNSEASAQKYATYFASSAYDAPASELAYITTDAKAPIFFGF
ncbi:hypothetical protein Q5H92_22905 [Hymenobacter sp. M29]|uniref:Uncharacterized protein n=1 Tax=Hymenobacter mellowenesis TaxID=3063995 RepID=A0ABT9AK92_9BACT|nr:DUF6712 family protein [Hymenobacter sp. M29]MDO7849232.1 hypothetical protein [Hymenobacter sp. M29]